MKKLTSKFPGLKVLVVEDNLINQEVCRDILELMGCDVAITSDGSEAVKLVREFPYDVILMDIQLPPGIDGYESARQIRRENLPKQPIVIALTASALDGDKEKALDAGMDDYVSKPMEASQLEDALLKYFKNIARLL